MLTLWPHRGRRHGEAVVHGDVSRFNSIGRSASIARAEGLTILTRHATLYDQVFASGALPLASCR